MWMDVWNCGCRKRYPHEWDQEGPGRTESGRPTVAHQPWTSETEMVALRVISGRLAVAESGNYWLRVADVNCVSAWKTGLRPT